jgi:hypothetical protein
MRPHSDLPGLSNAALRLLREDQPSDLEIARAYQRFTRPTRRSSRGLLLVSRWMIAGLVMGLGIAFGSEAVVRWAQPEPHAQPGAAPVVVPTVRKAAAVRAPLPSSQSAPEVATQGLPAPVAGFEPAPRPTSTASVKTPLVDPNDRGRADSAVWAKAAEGLRNNDFGKTQSALATLEHAGSAADREAARLIRAQLLLHQGNISDARALLQDLAEHAQSEAVRAKARSLLAESNSALNVTPNGT